VRCAKIPPYCPTHARAQYIKRRRRRRRRKAGYEHSFKKRGEGSQVFRT
jgi:hypothetical protein